MAGDPSDSSDAADESTPSSEEDPPESEDATDSDSNVPPNEEPSDADSEPSHSDVDDPSDAGGGSDGDSSAGDERSTDADGEGTDSEATAGGPDDTADPDVTATDGTEESDDEWQPADVESGEVEAVGPAEDTAELTNEPVGEAGEPLDDDWQSGGSWLDAPESDEERPLVEHLDEMFRRAAVVLVVLGVATALALPTAEFFINLLWDSFLPPGRSPRIYGPLELVLTELKVAALVGFVAALPALVYESYLFMRPGLYKHERRYYLASVPTSLILAVVGILFAYAVILPVVFAYFTGYTQHAAEVAFGLKATFDLILIMLGWFALIFQIPLFVMLAIMMGLTSREWMERRRVYFWGSFLGVAFLFSPDPTGMAPVMVAATMVGLFEGTLLLLRWTSGETGPLSVSALLAIRPYAWVGAAALGYLLSPLPAPSGYYGQLPAAVTGLIDSAGLRASAPFVVGGLLVAAYEAMVLLARRFGAPRRLRLGLHRARIPAWVSALVVGSLAAPEPVALARVGAIDLEPWMAALVAIVLVAAHEAVLAWSRRRSNRRA